MGVWNLEITDEQADEAYQEFADGWVREYEFTDDLPLTEDERGRPIKTEK